MSSADEQTSQPGTTPSEAGHAVDGRWQLVRFEDLKSAPSSVVPVSETQASAKPVPATQPKLRLERRQQLEHHLKESPTDLDGFMELGRIYRADDRPLEAKRILEQAKQIFPEELGLLWEYEEAVLARSLQQYQEVSELVSRLETPETERELKRSQNDWAHRRIEVCQSRLRRDSNMHHLRVVLAEAMYDAEMYKDAIVALKNVVNHDQLSPLAYLIQGRCLLALGNNVQAMVALRAVAFRRTFVAPLKTRIIALKILCETAEKLGVALTLAKYRQHLTQANQELAQRTVSGA